MPVSSEQLERMQEAEEAGEKTATCPSCNLQVPATSEFWFYSGKKRSDLCKECTRQESASKLTLSRKSKSLLQRVIKGQVLDTGNTEHLYDECIQQFGGLRSFVGELKLLFDEANNESTKVAVLRMIFSLASEADKSRRGDMVSTLIEDQDLLQVAARIEGMTRGADDASTP